jgi:hypothetical protein
VGAFNDAGMACAEPIIPDVEPSNAVSISAFIGKPQFGDPSFAEGRHDADFATLFMAAFDVRCQREDERFAEIFRKLCPDAPAGKGPHASLDHRARALCLDIRRRALDFAEWLDRAIVRLETALWPRVAVSKSQGKHGRHTVRVDVAGLVEREVSGAVFLALRTLAEGSPFAFGDRKALWRFRHAMPEVAAHLIEVPAAKGTYTHRLPDALRERITLS